MKVLIVEDEREIREFLVTQFKDKGIDALGLETGIGIINTLESFTPNALLVDQMMPGMSGAEIIKEVRSNSKFSEIPIMMVTGLDGEAEKIKAFDLGADDYVTKPFSVKEVVARVNALVRRSSVGHKNNIKNIVVGPLTIDYSSHKVLVSGAEVALTLTEFKIVSELAKNVGVVVSRDDLRSKALDNLSISDRTLDVHMASLRKKLLILGDKIETVRGVGYRLIL